MSRMPLDYREADFLSVAFYSSCAGASIEAQTKGFTLLKLVPGGSSRRRHEDKVPSSATAGAEFASSIPIKAKKLVLVTAFTPGEEHLQDYHDAQYQETHQKRSETVFQKTARYVIGQSIRETIRLLEEEGLDRSCIPLRLGGDYFYTKQFDDWIRERLSVEDCMGGAPPVRNSGILNAVVKQANEQVLEETAKRIVAKDQEHHRHEGASVETEGSSSTKRSNRGRRPVVCHREPHESEEEFEKRRMHLYGKRSYERKRRKLPSLQEQFQALDQANRHLRTNNGFLEGLIDQARRIVNTHYPMEYSQRHQKQQGRPFSVNMPNAFPIAYAGNYNYSHDEEKNDDISVGSLSFLELV
eukprot:scaffold34644_cov283-Amphora_coffeaeformis.AAC.1